MDVPVKKENYDKAIKFLIKEIENSGTFDANHGAVVVKAVVYLAKMLEDANTELVRLRKDHNHLVSQLRAYFEKRSNI